MTRTAGADRKSRDEAMRECIVAREARRGAALKAQ
jgi:hypothetical protein